MQTTRTITITENPQPAPLIIRLKRTKVDYGIALDNLANIIETVGNEMYNKWKDPLSFNLMDWSAKAMLVDFSDESKINELFEINVISTINQLAKKLLIDHIEKTPLRDPVLVEATFWTCEKVYVEMSGMTFDVKPVTTVPHIFASAMITWITSLQEESSSPPNTTQTIAKVGHELFNDAEMDSIKRSFLEPIK